MDRDELVRVLASMTSDEFDAVVAESRGVDDRDIKAVILRELSKPPRQPEPPALNSDAIEHRALG